LLELDIIKNSIHEKIYGSPSGAQCIFIPITDTIGAKIYIDQKERDYSYEWQNTAYENNLGPETHGKFEFVTEEGLYNAEMDDNIPAGSVLYGYLTEIVEIVGNLDIDFMEWEDENQDDIDDLYEELYQLGFKFVDNHVHNLGFKDGKLIGIDFGTY
jgi:hypothetical protein